MNETYEVADRRRHEELQPAELKPLPEELWYEF
jgi:hypothetical protein